MKFVAFFDILGFKELVELNSHEELTEIYEHFSKGALLSLANYKKQDGEIGKNTISQVDMADASVNSLIVSDSVIFWTDGHSPREFLEIIQACQLMLISSFKIGVPVRGGVSLGNFTYQNSSANSPKSNNMTTCFGKGLVNAYTLESNQEWSGCIVDKLALDHFQQTVASFQKNSSEELVDLQTLMDAHILVNYEAPLKKELNEYLVVNYFNYFGIEHGFNEQRIVSSFTAFNKKIANDSVKSKVDNTVQFYNHCLENGWVGVHKS